VVDGNYPGEVYWEIIHAINGVVVAAESSQDPSPPFCTYVCDAGSGWDIDVGACKACPKGSYGISGNCHICPYNTYGDVIGSAQCTACPSNTISGPGSIGNEQCIPGICLEVILYDTYGDGWNGNKLRLFDENHPGEGEESASFTFSYGFQKSKTVFLPTDRCYFGITSGGTYLKETSWKLTIPG